MYQNKPGFKDTPDSLPIPAFDDSQEKAEAAQAAWARAVAANEKNDRDTDERWEAAQRKVEGKQAGYVFAKSCALPDGVTNHQGFIPVESLKQYGTYAVLGSGSAMTAGATALEWIGGFASATALASRLGGTLAAVVPANLSIVVAALMPNTTSPDSAFYSSAQYAELTQGNTRARVTVKHLPDGSVDLYGFYTGGQSQWQNVPVIKAEPRGEQLVADFGGGIEIIWTPAADPNAVLGIPALKGVTLKPAVWVYPPGEKADQILINPEYPPDYQDAIIWFPSQPQIAPIYLSLSVRHVPGVVTGSGQDVSGIWLAGADTGPGAPIPTCIADRLRGRKFSSFDKFRAAFWEEVANDPELSAQFVKRNRNRMREGYAPNARERDTVGKRNTFELHHVERITDGGPVYDVDNLRVNTPKNHIENHR
ncbi:S-type pyocin domain-containing protein [Pseudomonas sp. NKUCC02_KPG]|uniref:S-type pyocin domain-containing protein n=1 Tax=Pseudomonas sp. NKUCC02_KPG TaxID=2842124 RepID=UPI001C5ACA47|nr:S-type pyocin domain-containing protein [Pseudomonas sp. NKUCC02_KPG]MBW3507011.1 S-type pyocin domain-containing protein [Pseudomonas sp. NKUCC02_KPG]